MHTLCSEMNLMMSAVRIGLRTKPVLRDRLFGVVLGAALLHGGYLVYPVAFMSSFLWCSSLVTDFVVGIFLTLCPHSVLITSVYRGLLIRASTNSNVVAWTSNRNLTRCSQLLTPIPVSKVSQTLLLCFSLTKYNAGRTSMTPKASRLW